jgi:hypothetical protein
MAFSASGALATVILMSERFCDCCGEAARDLIQITSGVNNAPNKARRYYLPNDGIRAHIEAGSASFKPDGNPFYAPCHGSVKQRQESSLCCSSLKPVPSLHKKLVFDKSLSRVSKTCFVSQAKLPAFPVDVVREGGALVVVEAHETVPFLVSEVPPSRHNVPPTVEPINDSSLSRLA